jgi:glycosyltransferase involved in cell wall biosynthesis
MTFTLAISAKNARGVIEECLVSIQQQTVPPDTVLVVVDDPRDNTIAVAQAFGATAIINQGKKLYQARNTALRHCSTDILAFTDADCVLDPSWVKRIKEIFREKPDVVAGTGSHPMIGKHNFSSWLHHMWFLVETRKNGYTDGVIGGNAYFRTDALRRAGGWLPVELMAAEDVYISRKILEIGGKIWFDEGVVARHHYKPELGGFLRQAVMMGRDIVLMMKAAGIRGGLWYYTLAIPLLAIGAAGSGLGALFGSTAALFMLLAIFIVTFLYLLRQFKNPVVAATRWLARWVIIWPYAWGIIKGLMS